MTSRVRATSGAMPSSPPASCASTISSVLPASRSASISPMHTIAPSPPASTARAFLPTLSFVSPKNCRRSLWPTIDHVAPASASSGAETSPVNAPALSQKQSCAQVAIDEPSSRLATCASAVYGGATPTATPRAAPSWFLSSVTSASASAIVLLSFQLPTTNGVRMPRVLSRPANVELARARAVMTAVRVRRARGLRAGQLDDPLELGRDQHADVRRAGVPGERDGGHAVANVGGDVAPLVVAAPERRERREHGLRRERGRIGADRARGAPDVLGPLPRV